MDREEQRQHRPAPLARLNDGKTKAAVEQPDTEQ
jgi:hypothetical protein